MRMKSLEKREREKNANDDQTFDLFYVMMIDIGTINDEKEQLTFFFFSVLCFLILAHWIVHHFSAECTMISWSLQFRPISIRYVPSSFKSRFYLSISFCSCIVFGCAKFSECFVNAENWLSVVEWWLFFSHIEYAMFRSIFFSVLLLIRDNPIFVLTISFESVHRFSTESMRLHAHSNFTQSI